MGVDAYIYCKTTDGEEPAFCDNLPSEAMVVPAGEWAPTGATHEITQYWRYYGPGYERGPWPSIAATLMALYACENVEVVWYFGDCSETDYPFTRDRVQEYNAHYMANGDRPYRPDWYIEEVRKLCLNAT